MTRKAMIVVVAATMLVEFAGCQPQAMVAPPESRPAKFYKVTSAEEKLVRTYPAVVEAMERSKLSFRVDGTVAEIYADQGKEVKKGELIARLDARDYELTLDRATSQLQELEAQERALKTGARPEDIRILEARVAAAKSEYEKNERFFEQRKPLVAAGAISREELEKAESTYLVSKSALETAEKELEKGRIGARKEDIEAIEARVRDMKQNVKNAENALADTRLIAPYAGRIIERYVEAFEDVRAKQPIVNLQQIDFIKLSFGLPENVVFNLERGNVGTFSAVFAGMPGKEFPVERHEVRMEADPKTRTFLCWVKMPSPPGAIVLPGMSAEILHRNPRADVPGVPVPSGALFADASKAYFVWKIDPETMTVHRTPVEIGPLSGDDAWVTKGLQPGDVVIAAGANYLNDGAKVHAMESKD